MSWNVSQGGRYCHKEFDIHEYKHKELAGHFYAPIMPSGPEADLANELGSMNTRMFGINAQLADLGFERVDELAKDLSKGHRGRQPEAGRGRSRARGDGSVRRGRHELRERSVPRRGVSRNDTGRHGMVMPNDDNTIAASWHTVGQGDDHMAAGLSSLHDGQAHRRGPNFNPDRRSKPVAAPSRDIASMIKTTQNNITPKITESSLSLKHSKYAPDQLKNEAIEDRRKMIGLQAKYGHAVAAGDALEQAQTSLFRWKDAAAKIEKGIVDLRAAGEETRETKKTELETLVSENWLDLLAMQKDAQEKLACLPDLAGSKWAS